jgi:cell division protein FtsB
MSLSELGIDSFSAETLQGFDLGNVQPGERLKGKSRQFVRFYNHTELQTRTVLDEMGKPKGSVSEEVTRVKVKIITPGDKNIIDDYATDWHKEEFYPQYEAFMKGKGGIVGTPLSAVPFIPPSKILELKVKGVVTLEQLADSSDVLADSISNGRLLRDHAIAQVKANIANQSSAEVNLLKKQMADMQKQNEALMAVQIETEKELRLLASQKTAPVIGSVEEIEEATTVKKGKK